MYLTRLRGRSGYYYRRFVPTDIRTLIGRSRWQKKLSDSLTEAKLLAAEYNAIVEREIAVARGTIKLTEEERLLSSTWDYETPFTTDVRDVPAIHLFPGVPEEEAHRLHQIAGQAQDGTSPELHTAEELIALATRLKDPKPSTIYKWELDLRSFLSSTGKNFPALCTRADAVSYRDHALTSMSHQSAKNQLGILRGLWEVMLTSQWVTENIWDGLRKTIKVRPKQKTLPLPNYDSVPSLPAEEQLLFWMLRLTGARYEEMAGLRSQDIDLNSMLITITPHEKRSLKIMPWSDRVVPIHPFLVPLLQDLSSPFVFPSKLPSGQRTTQQWTWKKVEWKQRLNVTPLGLRNLAPSLMRDAGINERVIGSLMGHGPSNTTGGYGTVTLEVKQKAILTLYP